MVGKGFGYPVSFRITLVIIKMVIMIVAVSY